MDRKTSKFLNIAASFSNDMLLSGSTQVPNMLLIYYRKMGISDIELVILIQLIYFTTFESVRYPSVDKLAEIMHSSNQIIQEGLARLIEKGLLIVDKVYCTKTKDVYPCYSLEPLFKELSCIWALEKQNALMASQAVLEDDVRKDTIKVYRSFEKEFGRLLAPLESEKIKSWIYDLSMPTDLIFEALQRAILRGVRNCQYIDRILVEWHKIGIKSLEELQKHEDTKIGKQPQAKRKANENLQDDEDEFAQLYLS